MIILDLTSDQVGCLAGLEKQVTEAKKEGTPGMIIGQVFPDNSTALVEFIPNRPALKIIATLRAYNDDRENRFEVSEFTY